jgi:hypothetical protein
MKDPITYDEFLSYCNKNPVRTADQARKRIALAARVALTASAGERNLLRMYVDFLQGML